MVAMTEPSAKQWLFSMMDSLSHTEFIEMITTLWAIWYARRRFIHEGEQQKPLSTFMFVRNFLNDLTAVPKKISIKPSGSKPVRWIAPPAGLTKLNVDAATSKQGAGGAVAVVCRDEMGQFLGASALILAEPLNPPTLEAVACREGLALAQDLGLTRVCVASDCLEVINNLTRPYSGEYSMITSEINLTAQIFQSVTFRHEKRVSNGEAHRLARSSVNQEVGRRLWLLDPPENLCIPLVVNLNQ
jgi:hypothetical protein